MSDVARIAVQLEIGAARSAAWISAVPGIFGSCDGGTVAQAPPATIRLSKISTNTHFPAAGDIGQK